MHYFTKFTMNLTRSIHALYMHFHAFYMLFNRFQMYCKCSLHTFHMHISFHATCVLHRPNAFYINCIWMLQAFCMHFAYFLPCVTPPIDTHPTGGMRHFTCVLLALACVLHHFKYVCTNWPAPDMPLTCNIHALCMHFTAFNMLGTCSLHEGPCILHAS